MPGEFAFWFVDAGTEGEDEIPVHTGDDLVEDLVDGHSKRAANIVDFQHPFAELSVTLSATEHGCAGGFPCVVPEEGRELTDDPFAFRPCIWEVVVFGGFRRGFIHGGGDDRLDSPFGGGVLEGGSHDDVEDFSSSANALNL